MTVHFETATLRQVTELAVRRRVTKSAIIEAAVASFLSPDAADQREAATARRLDRLSRQIERLERDVTIGNEAVALFLRHWLSLVPPLPTDAQKAAQAKGRERFADFVDALGRRVRLGRSLAAEVLADTEGPAGSSVEDANRGGPVS